MLQYLHHYWRVCNIYILTQDKHSFICLCQLSLVCSTTLHYLTHPVNTAWYACVNIIVMQYYIALFDSSSQIQPNVCSTILHYLTHQVKQSLQYAVPYCIIWLISQHRLTCLWQHYHICNTIIFVALYTTLCQLYNCNKICCTIHNICVTLVNATQLYQLHYT